MQLQQGYAAGSLLPGPLQHDAMINRAAIIVYHHLHPVLASEFLVCTIQNDMKINKRKTKELVIDLSKTRTNFPTIRIDGTNTQRITEAKILGIAITNNLMWDVHVDEITRKTGKRLFLLVQLKRSGISVKTF